MQFSQCPDTTVGGLLYPSVHCKRCGISLSYSEIGEWMGEGADMMCETCYDELRVTIDRAIAELEELRDNLG